ncbi:hypothetical protein [Halarchaeum sp. P4]|uniref:hypothetical protein n=1 Tax=Halarchaeum sp. P4 TaxID=3421639 RepID=UPI003EB97972
MSPADSPPRRPEDGDDHPSVQCDACEEALTARRAHSPSFLLLETFTAPLIGCPEHLEEFATICGYATATTPDLLEHRPAGGISCPSCRLAPHNPTQLVIPVRGGAVASLLCPTHQAELVTQFQNGLDTQQQLTDSLDRSL